MVPRSLLTSRAALASAALVVAAVAVLGMVLWLGADDEPPPPAAQPEPEPPTPSEPPEPPPPPPPPPPVSGTTELVEVVDLSVHGSGLFGASRPEDEPVPVDDAAIDTFVGALGARLDAHLTDLQDGGDGQLAIDGTDAPSPFTTTVPDVPVTDATYRVRVYARGAAEWADVEVEVAYEGGRTAAFRLAAAPGGDPADVVVLAGQDGA